MMRRGLVRRLSTLNMMVKPCDRIEAFEGLQRRSMRLLHRVVPLYCGNTLLRRHSDGLRVNFRQDIIQAFEIQPMWWKGGSDRR